MFATLWFRLASYAAAAIVSASLTGYIVHRMDASKLSDLKTANARAVSEAIKLAADRQSAQDAVTLKSAVNEAQAQQKIVTHTVTITKKVPTYVTAKIDARLCVPYGLVRVLDATVLQTDPDALSLPAGKFDDTCSPLKASDLAAHIVENYAAAQANAEQLTRFQQWVHDQESISHGPN